MTGALRREKWAAAATALALLFVALSATASATSPTPVLVISHGEPVVTTPLVTATISVQGFVPVEMAFSHDAGDFLPWEPFQSSREWPVNDPERTYQAYLEKLSGGRSFSEWDNEYGTLAWGESFVLESLLEMYAATGRESYLGTFVDHVDAVIAQGDDHAGKPDYRGLMLPGWSTSGYSTLARTVYTDSLGLPAVEISGRSQLRQNQVAVRLTLTGSVTNTLWALGLHRSMAGQPGIVLSDTTPGLSAPDWASQTWPDALAPNDSLVYDTFYPWFMLAEVRLYGVDGSGLEAGDFELYVAPHADAGEYTPVGFFTLNSLTDQGLPVLSFRGLSEWGRFLKVHYVGDRLLPFHPPPGAPIRVYEAGEPPCSERFVAPDLDTLAAAVEQGSNLARLSVLTGTIPTPSPMWRSLTPQRYRMALHTGLITYPMLRFAQLVAQQDLGLWRAKAEGYLKYAQAAVHSHDDEWHSESSTRGYYIYRHDAPLWCNGVNLPLNQQAAMGRSLIALYGLTGEEVYRNRAMQIAQVLRDGLTYDLATDSYWWYYWFGEGYEGWRDVPGRFVPTYSGYKGVETIFYASIDTDLAQMAYANGWIFSFYDVLRLANTFLNRLTTEEGQWNCHVDGERGVMRGYGPGGVEPPAIDAAWTGSTMLGAGCAYGDEMTTTEYLGLTRVVPAVYQRVAAFELFPPSAKSSGRAPYGLARLINHATWKLDAQPGDHTLCVRLRDQQGTVSGPWCANVALNLWRQYLPSVFREGGR